MKLTLFLTFIILTNHCFSQADPANQTIPFVKNNYSLQYPKSWRVDTSGNLGPELFVFAPLEDEKDKFSENINVLVQDLTGHSIDLEKYKQITDKQVTDLATDGKILESSILKTDKGEFYKITYTMTQGKYSIKITSQCFIINNKAYLVTFSSELDKYDKYKKVAEEILSSFSLTK